MKKLASVTVGLFMVLSCTLFVNQLRAQGSGTLFGTDANGRNLITINKGTGAGAVVGLISGLVHPSLALDPTTGIMYAGSGGGNPLLFTVSTVTGAGIFVGNTGLGFAAVGGMDFAPNGLLFAAVNIAGDGGTGSDHLAFIDKTTAAAIIIGPFGACVGVPPIPVNGVGFCTIEGIETIAFSPSGILYGAKTTRGAAGLVGLYTINPITGAAAFAGPILNSTTGAPPSGGVTSLQFGCDGTLYGGTARGTSAADGGFLITINPANGQFAFVGGATATSFGQSLGGLAFGAECRQIDIKPGSDPNSINTRSNGVIPVALLGSAGFDVTTVDVTTLEFGPSGASPAHDLSDPSVYLEHLQDVNFDGFVDLVSHYRQKATGLVPGDLQACLTMDMGVMGCDAVNIVK